MPEDFPTYYWKINMINPSFYRGWTDFEILDLSLLEDYDSFCTYLMISV